MMKLFSKGEIGGAGRRRVVTMAAQSASFSAQEGRHVPGPSPHEQFALDALLESVSGRRAILALLVCSCLLAWFATS